MALDAEIKAAVLEFVDPVGPPLERKESWVGGEEWNVLHRAVSLRSVTTSPVYYEVTRAFQTVLDPDTGEIDGLDFDVTTFFDDPEGRASPLDLGKLVLMYAVVARDVGPNHQTVIALHNYLRKVLPK